MRNWGRLKVLHSAAIFGIGNFEDTVEQFKAFVEEAEYRPVTLSPGWEAHEEGAPPTSGFMQHQMSPVACVSWKRCGPPVYGLAEPQDRHGGLRTQPVGRYTAIGNGIYNVYGNIWELTPDCWSDGYLKNSDPAKRGKADCS